jgi:hypothetical protein
MLYLAQIRLTAPLVGDTWDNNRRIFCFPRASDNSGDWALGDREKTWLMSLVENAINALYLDIDADSVRWPQAIRLPRLYLLNINNRKGGRFREHGHEAISRNTKLSFYIMTREQGADGRLRCPSQQHLYEITKFIGRFEGISPFGSDKGFGLYTVESLAPVGGGCPGDYQPAAESAQAADAVVEENGKGESPVQDPTPSD